VKLPKVPNDSISHPEHYNNHPSGVECKEISKWFSHPLASAIEYIWRAELKHESPEEDIRKAIFWLQEYLSMMEEAKSIE